MSWDTSAPILRARPYLQLERWSTDSTDLWLVPLLTWQASLFIHRRKLSLYA